MGAYAVLVLCVDQGGLTGDESGRIFGASVKEGLAM